MDYVLSGVVNGFQNRKTWISYHNGGFVIQNSVGAEMFNAPHAGGLAGHIGYGESKAKLKHEVSHIHQSLNGGGWGNWEDPSYTTLNEHDNDFRGFTADYHGMYAIYRRIFPDPYFRNILLMNAVYGNTMAGILYKSRISVDSHKNDQGVSDPDEGLENYYHMLDALFIISEYSNSQRTFLFGIL